MSTSERSTYLDWVEKQAARGTPYCWPHASNGFLGKGLQRPDMPEALDCSGTVTCGLYVATRGRIDWRGTHNAAKLFEVLETVETPRPGDLVFYLEDGAFHVMTCVGDGRVVGASGGGRKTLSVEIAQKTGARVKYRAGVDYRRGRVGFRALPVE